MLQPSARSVVRATSDRVSRLATHRQDTRRSVGVRRERVAAWMTRQMAERVTVKAQTWLGRTTVVPTTRSWLMGKGTAAAAIVRPAATTAVAPDQA